MPKLRLDQFGAFVKQKFPEFEKYENDKVAEVFLKHYPEYEKYVDINIPPLKETPYQLRSEPIKIEGTNVEIPPNLLERLPFETKPVKAKLADKTPPNIITEPLLESGRIPPVKVFKEPELTEQPPLTIGQRIGRMLGRSTEQQTAEALNIRDVSKYFGIQPQEVTKEHMRQYAMEHGAATQPTSQELLSTGMTAGLLFAPVPSLMAGKIAEAGKIATEIGLSIPIFETLDKIAPTEEIKKDLNEYVGGLIDIADFMVKGAIAGGLAYKTGLPKLVENKIRNLQIKERSLSVLNDKQLLDIYKTLPDPAKRVMADTNSRIREILQRGEVEPTIAKPIPKPEEVRIPEVTRPPIIEPQPIKEAIAPITELSKEVKSEVEVKPPKIEDTITPQTPQHEIDTVSNVISKLSKGDDYGVKWYPKPKFTIKSFEKEIKENNFVYSDKNNVIGTRGFLIKTEYLPENTTKKLTSKYVSYVPEKSISNLYNDYISKDIPTEDIEIVGINKNNTNELILKDAVNYFSTPKGRIEPFIKYVGEDIKLKKIKDNNMVKVFDNKNKVVGIFALNKTTPESENILKFKPQIDKDFENDLRTISKTKELTEEELSDISNEYFSRMRSEDWKELYTNKNRKDILNEIAEELKPKKVKSFSEIPSSVARVEKTKELPKLEKPTSYSKKVKDISEDLEKIFVKTEGKELSLPEDLKQVFGGIDKITPITNPGLFLLASELIERGGIKLAKLKVALGKYVEKENEKYIKLSPKLFQNPEVLKKVFAHEIGHLVDNLKKVSDKRNIIERLINFKLNVKDIFNETLPTNAKIKEELFNLSKWWHPFDEDKVPLTYLEYRNNPNELYADFISVLLNSPGDLVEKSPLSLKLFFDNIQKKPEFLKAYKELLESISGGKVIPEKIETKMDKDMAFAELKRLANLMYGNKQDSFLNEIRKNFVDIYSRLWDDVDKIVAKGENLNTAIDPRRSIQQFVTTTNEQFLYLFNNSKIMKALEDAQISYEDFSKYLMYNRIANGDREALANPFNITKPDAERKLKEMASEFGDKWPKLLEIAKQWYDNNWEYVKKGKGIFYDDETIKILEKNKNAYSTFNVAKYIKSMYVKPFTPKQEGTLQSIGSPLTNTILKMVAYLDRLSYEQFKKNIKAFYDNYYPNLIEKKGIRPEGKEEIQITKPEELVENKKTITIWEDGKIVEYLVPKEIADLFNSDKMIIEGAGFLSKILFSNFWNKVLIDYNPSFAVRNLNRDFLRTWSNINVGGITGFLRWVGEAIKNIPEAYSFIQKGELTPKIKEAIENRVYPVFGGWVKRSSLDEKELTKIFNDFLENMSKGRTQEESIILQTLETANKLYAVKELHHKKSLSEKLLTPFETISKATQIMEVVSKVATYNNLKTVLNDAEKAGMGVFYYAGTPAWLLKGKFSPITNQIARFSNIMLQGLRFDLRASMGKDSDITGQTPLGWWFKKTPIMMIKFATFLITSGIIYEHLKNKYDNETDEEKKEAYLNSLKTVNELDDIYSRVSEYFMTNYAIIPLGKVSGGDYGYKSMYFTMPLDDTSRLLSGLLWKTLQLYKGSPKQVYQIFDFLGSQGLPSIHPTIDVTTNWFLYITGNNPVDWWAGKNIIKNNNFKVGGWPATKDMVLWTLDKTNSLRVYQYNSKVDTTIELVIKNTPVISPFIKISDYGLIEKGKEEMEELEREKILMKYSDSKETREFFSRYWQLKDVMANYQHERNTGGKLDISTYTIQEWNRYNNFYNKVVTPSNNMINKLVNVKNYERAKIVGDTLKERISNFYTQIEEWRNNNEKNNNIDFIFRD